MTAHVQLFPNNPQEGDHQVNNTSAMKAATVDPMASNANDTDAQALLNDLRSQYESLRNDVSAAVAKRAEQASELAGQGADTLRTQIRSAPVASIAAAVLAGGVLAVLLVPRRPEPTWRDTAVRYGNSLRDVDVAELANSLRRSADNTLTSARDQAAGFMPSVERLAQSLSTVDSSTFSPAIEKGTELLRSVWGKVSPNLPSVKS